MDSKHAKRQIFLKVNEALADIFNEESENCILEYLEDHGTEVFNVISNLVPCKFYNSLTGNNLNIIDFNHVANKLAWQSIKEIESNDEEE